MEKYEKYNEIGVKTKEEWLKVLTNEEKLKNNKIIEILKFVYIAKDHTSNIQKIAQYLNTSVDEVNMIISSFGKRVWDLLELPAIKENLKWDILFKNESDMISWQIRPELIEAIEEKYDWKDMYILQNYGKSLKKYKKYSRKDIHDIFSPYTKFTPHSGAWGLRGIIPVPNTVADYIFLVTYGANQAGHDFVESIDENGILEWQSQPSQTLKDKQIQTFINHDYNMANIYLFLRKDKYSDYAYLGKLAYVSHDNERECPVYFKWQILDWDPNYDIDLPFKKIEQEDDLAEIDPSDFTVNHVDNQMVFTKVERKGISTKEFNNINRNFQGEALKHTKLGNMGEDVVVSDEKKHLREIGRYDLAEKVIATRNYAGNAEKFDVLSFEDNGIKKYIEVKTTTGPANNPFYISENEVKFSEDERFKDHYYLYRLFNFDKMTRKADLVKVKGPIDRDKLSAEKYRCSLDDILEK